MEDDLDNSATAVFNFTPRYVECPYNKHHLLGVENTEWHISSCRKKYFAESTDYARNEVVKICKYNMTHKVRWLEYRLHLEICPDRVRHDAFDYPGHTLMFWVRRRPYCHTVFVEPEQPKEEDLAAVKKSKKKTPEPSPPAPIIYQGDGEEELMFPMEL